MEYNSLETQSYNSDYLITLLSGDIITIYSNSENIIDERDGYISIDIETPTYCQRLYDAFKNKELVKSIKRISKHRNVGVFDLKISDINREFIYDNYFKINAFNIFLKESEETLVVYNIKFQSV